MPQDKPFIDKLLRYGKIALYVYLAGFVGVFLFQRFILLHPKPYHYKKKYPFEAREFNVITSDNLRINALMFSPSGSVNKGIVMYLHGNADNLERWGKYADEFTKRGYSVIMYDYRGFGKSEGRLDENNLLADAQLVYNDITRRFDEKNIILYGRSLGTGVATYLASINKPKLLILETPYYSLPDAVFEAVPLYPYSMFLEFKMPTYQWIVNVKSKIHIFHGTSDYITPYNQSLKLAKVLQKKPEEIITTLPNGKHKGLDKFKEYQLKMDELLK